MHVFVQSHLFYFLSIFFVPSLLVLHPLPAHNMFFLETYEFGITSFTVEENNLEAILPPEITSSPLLTRQDT